MPRQVDHEQRRFEIVTAVWQLLATGGPAAVTMRAVAAEAGVSVGRIQHYFPTKAAMLVHGLRALVGAAEVQHDEAATGRGPREELVDLLVHAVPVKDHTRIGTAVWYAYLASGVDRPEIADLVRATLEQAQERATVLVTELTGASPGEAAAQARDLLGLSDGLSVRVLVGALAPEVAVQALTERVDALRR